MGITSYLRVSGIDGIFVPFTIVPSAVKYLTYYQAILGKNFSYVCNRILGRQPPRLVFLVLSSVDGQPLAGTTYSNCSGTHQNHLMTTVGQVISSRTKCSIRSSLAFPNHKSRSRFLPTVIVTSVILSVYPTFLTFLSYLGPADKLNLEPDPPSLPYRPASTGGIFNSLPHRYARLRRPAAWDVSPPSAVMIAAARSIKNHGLISGVGYYLATS